jgi:hypothetical protein
VQLQVSSAFNPKMPGNVRVHTWQPLYAALCCFCTAMSK